MTTRTETFLGLTKTQFALAAALLSVLSVAFSVFTVIQIGGVADQARQAAAEVRTTSCAQKDNVKKQIAGTEEYLDAHPGPEPIKGIKRAELLRSLDRQKTFLASFHGVTCPND